MARGSAGESALRRHLRVLSAFETRHPFLSLTEIANRAGLPKSTTHRLLAELEGEGLVERDVDRAYRLGVRLYELASRTPGALGLREIARPFLAQVHARVRQHVQLGVLAGTDILWIERLSARESTVNWTKVGGRIPLHVSSGGIVLLAHAPAELVDEVAGSPMRRYTECTIVTADALRRELDRVRAQGFAALAGHLYEGSTGIAVPVFGPHRRIYAALGVVVPNDGTPPRQYVELLRAAAEQIEQALVDAAAG